VISSPDEEPTGDLGNRIAGVPIGACGIFLFPARNLCSGDFGLLQLDPRGKWPDQTLNAIRTPRMAIDRPHAAASNRFREGIPSSPIQVSSGESRIEAKTT
jgi:hypothetical protein